MRPIPALLLLAACGPVDVADDRDCPPETCLEGELGTYTIDAYTERDGLCFAWTVDNDAALYVNAVTAENDGAFHHSNWFWVHESEWDVGEGPWDCAEHEFTELKAATRGGVLFAQSTQLEREEQRFLPGYAVKIPPRSRIIAFAHLLNTTAEEHTSTLRTRLDLVPEDEVLAALAPARFTYLDLDIPAGARTEHYGACRVRDYYEVATGGPFDIRLHYLLPHFHTHGSGFTAELLGGPRDGERIVELRDAWGHPFGTTFDEPVDLSEADGLRLACEHQNGTDADVGWGIGDQEMCVALMFYESRLMFENTVIQTAEASDVGDPLTRTGDCVVVGAPFDP